MSNSAGTRLDPGEIQVCQLAIIGLRGRLTKFSGRVGDLPPIRPCSAPQGLQAIVFVYLLDTKILHVATDTHPRRRAYCRRRSNIYGRRNGEPYGASTKPLRLRRKAFSLRRSLRRRIDVELERWTSIYLDLRGLATGGHGHAMAGKGTHTEHSAILGRW